jgi:hypothetical protein
VEQRIDLAATIASSREVVIVPAVGGLQTGQVVAALERAQAVAVREHVPAVAELQTGQVVAVLQTGQAAVVLRIVPAVAELQTGQAAVVLELVPAAERGHRHAHPGALPRTK